MPNARLSDDKLRCPQTFPPKSWACTSMCASSNIRNMSEICLHTKLLPKGRLIYNYQERCTEPEIYLEVVLVFGSSPPFYQVLLFV